MSAPPTLPYDVLRCIFDGLCGKDLKECSLVCRHWALSTNYHLFRELVVRTYVVHWTSTGHIVAYIDKTRQRCREFLDVARSSERVRLTLRKLTICSEQMIPTITGRPVVDGSDDETGSGAFKCPLGTLQDILVALPYLQNLHLVGIEFYPAPSGSPILQPSSGVTRSRSIDTLDISSLSGPCGDILRCFDKIGRLSLGRYAAPELEKALSTAALPTVEIPILDFLNTEPNNCKITENCSFKATIDTLRGVLDLRKLEHVEIEQHGVVDEGFLILFHESQGIKSLSVKGPGSEAKYLPNWFVPRYNLNPGYSLHVFRFWNIVLQLRIQRYGLDEVPREDGFCRSPNGVNWICMCHMLSIVAEVSSVTDVELCIDFDAFVEDQLGTTIRGYLANLDWAKLDRWLRLLGGHARVLFKIAETTRFGEEFIFMMRQKLSQGAREQVRVERSITYVDRNPDAKPERKEELRGLAKSSMGAVEDYSGVTVLRTDPDGCNQELLLLDDTLALRRSRR